MRIEHALLLFLGLYLIRLYVDTFSVFRGRYAFYFFKNPAEIEGVIIADNISYFG